MVGLVPGVTAYQAKVSEGDGIALSRAERWS